jgi:hypothetical protein
MRYLQPQPLRPTALHPMDATDRQIIEALPASNPSDLDIVQAARLLVRYRDSLLSTDLHEQLQQTLAAWGLTALELNARARTIWQSGWRPALSTDQQEVGSGADVEG